MSGEFGFALGLALLKWGSMVNWAGLPSFWNPGLKEKILPLSFCAFGAYGLKVLE
jgi:hypothetical protein